jgi:uncharacterized protein
MRRLFASLSLLAVPLAAAALDVPPPPRAYFNDYANVVSAGTAAQIEGRLAAIEQNTGHQVVVAVFRSLEGDSLEDFTIRCAERWRVGRKGLDDGAIFFVFPDDRRMRLEVGYGLEGTIPDAMSARLLDLAKPYFLQQDYGGGILAVVGGIDSLFKGEPPPERRARRRDGTSLGDLLTILLMLVFLPLLLARRRGRRPGIWWGGFGGPGAGGFGGGGFGGFSGGGGGFGGGGASGGW